MKIKHLFIPLIFYYACFFFRDLFIGRDAAVFLLLSRSLSNNNGYLDYYLPQASPHALCPPGYPFLLSLVCRFFGNGLFYSRLLSLVLSGTALLILAKLFSRSLNRKETLLALLLFGLNPAFVHFTYSIASEPAYLVFSWLAILLVMRNNLLSARKVFLVALLIVAAFYVRTIGIALYSALLVYLFEKKLYRQGLIALLSGLLILPWVIYLSGTTGNYARVFIMQDVYNFSAGTIGLPGLFLRALSNIKYYSGKVIADLLFFPYFKEITFGNPFFCLKIILSLFFSGLFLAGFCAFLKRKGLGLLEIYLIGYSIILLFWPYHGQHFLIPVYPFLLIYLFIFLRGEKIKFLSAPLIAGLLLVVLAANLQAVTGLKRKKILPQTSLSLLESYSWLKGNIAQGASIISFDPAGVYFYTGRKGYPLDLWPDKIKKANYLLLSQEDKLGIWPGELPPAYFTLVYQTSAKPAVNIYKLK